MMDRFHRWQYSIRNLFLVMTAIALSVQPMRLFCNWATPPKTQQSVTVPNGGTMIIGGRCFFLDSKSRTTRRSRNLADSEKASTNSTIIVSVGPRVIIEEEEETLFLR